MLAHPRQNVPQVEPLAVIEEEEEEEEEGEDGEEEEVKVRYLCSITFSFDHSWDISSYSDMKVLFAAYFNLYLHYIQ